MRDIIRSDDSPASLRSIFADEKIVKIMHGCDTDIKYLVADLNMPTLGLFDTARAMSFLQKVPKLKEIKKEGRYQINRHVNLISLENLTKSFVGLEMDKYFQVSDWRVRPLLQGMMDYARNDSHYLIAIYVMLIKLLNPGVFQKQPNTFGLPHLPFSVIDLAEKDVNPWLENIKDICEDVDAAAIFSELLVQFSTLMQAFSVQK